MMYFPTVMIVEDAELTALYIEKRIKSFGAGTVVRFANGKDALEYVKQHKIDVVIMDVEIEGDWDGIETAHHIKKYQNLPLIFLSAHTEDSFLKRVVELDPLGYLVKPLHDESLRVMLSLAFHKLKYIEELKSKDKWLTSILNNLQEGVVGIDLDGKIIFINPIAERILSEKLHNVIGKTFNEILTFYDEDNRPFLLNPIQNAIEKGVAKLANNVMIQTAKGRKECVNYSVTVLFDENKRKMGALICMQLQINPADAVA